MGPRSFWIQITGQKNVLHSNKNTDVCYILSFIMFSQKHTAAELPHPILGPITPGFVSGLSLGS